jgi:hypothetical protein
VAGNQVHEHGLLAYMVGWRKGAGGGFSPPDSSEHEKAGFAAGKQAREAAYGAACEHYKYRLGVMRLQGDPPEEAPV